MSNTERFEDIVREPVIRLINNLPRVWLALVTRCVLTIK